MPYCWYGKGKTIFSASVPTVMTHSEAKCPASAPADVSAAACAAASCASSSAASASTAANSATVSPSALAWMAARTASDSTAAAASWSAASIATSGEASAGLMGDAMPSSFGLAICKVPLVVACAQCKYKNRTWTFIKSFSSTVPELLPDIRNM